MGGSVLPVVPHLYVSDLITSVISDVQVTDSRGINTPPYNADVQSVNGVKFRITIYVFVNLCSVTDILYFWFCHSK